MFGVTIVQHSGFGYAGKPGFEFGLETRILHTKAELAIVRKADGLVFNNYNEAEDFCEEAMYPSDNPGLVPTAKGTFSDKEIDGLRIYVPVRKVVG